MTMATLARVYAALADVECAGEEDNRRQTAEEHCALVTVALPSRGRLLDVGCATGVFAGVAHQHGWNVTGLDASAWATARARPRHPGVAFVTGPVEAAPFPPESYEAVTLWDVIEHVPSPLDTLRQLHRWLAPRGCLFLNLPNAESGVARCMGRHWVLLLREHSVVFLAGDTDKVVDHGWIRRG